MDEIELKKREDRIKRFGKVEPLVEIDSKRKFKKNANINHRLDNFSREPIHTLDFQNPTEENNYLYIKKIDFDLGNSEKNQNENNLLQIEPAVKNEKKKEVNLMSTEDLEEYFGKGKVKKIFWLNDYSCVVEFDNESSSLATFEELTERKIDSEKSDLENFDWKKSKSFKVDNEDVEIMLRISDEEDILKKSPKRESKYYELCNRRRKDVRGKGRYNNDNRERSRDRFLENKNNE